MADTILGGLTLPGDLEWTDEYAEGSDLVGQVVTYSITGAQLIQAGARQAGRKITLEGRMDGDEGFAAVALSTLVSLRALASVPAEEYTLILSDGREFTVVFRRDDGGPSVSAEPMKHIAPHSSTDYWFPTIRLLQI